MLTAVSIENFRSIARAELNLAPLVVLYGPAASGKSSVLYALLTLRNFIVNPNRPVDALFHLGFMDLGGFDACVFNHERARSVAISVLHHCEGSPVSYELVFSKSKASLKQQFGNVLLKADVPIPYGLNQTFPFEVTVDGDIFNINWNGISSSVSPKDVAHTSPDKAFVLATQLNSSAELIKNIDVVPHKRGFFKPNYTVVPISPTPTTEDEVASSIISDPNLAPRISAYLEEIVGRDFRLHTPRYIHFFLFDHRKKVANAFLPCKRRLWREPGCLSVGENSAYCLEHDSYRGA